MRKYPPLKHGAIARGSLDEIDSVGGDLLVQVGEFAVDLAGYFGEIPDKFNPESANAERSLLRGRVGFDFLRFATMEHLLMLQEGALLTSFANPDIRCSELIEELSLSFDAEDFTARLQNTQAMFVEHTAAPARVPFAFNESSANHLSLLDSAREEAEFDVENFSFDASAQIQFMDEYVQRTVAMCEAIKNDAFYRNQFATDVGLEFIE